MATKKGVFVTTGNSIDGYHISEYLGIVRGIVVRATGIGRGIVGGLKSIVGGNVLKFYRVTFDFSRGVVVLEPLAGGAPGGDPKQQPVVTSQS